MTMEEKTVKPGLFEKGGRLGWLHSTWDAFDTFLRVPSTVTSKGAHVRDSLDIKRVMILVVIALVRRPCSECGTSVTSIILRSETSPVSGTSSSGAL